MGGNLADVHAALQSKSRWTCLRPGARTLAAAATILLALAILATGCSARNKPVLQPAASPSPAAAQALSEEPSQSVVAKITISYEKPEDTLQSVSVSQFTGATIIRTRSVNGKESASIIRFDGGIPIWKFHSTRSVLNPLSEIGRSTYRVEQVAYGAVPQGFVQDVPDSGPPAPLAPGSYYIFKIERGSGSTSYEAVKVNADTTLQVYDADPRAGTSYELCCDVSADFAQPTPSDFSGQVQ